MRGEALAAHPRADGTATPGRPLSRGRADHPVQVAGTTLLADPDGALYSARRKTPDRCRSPPRKRISVCQARCVATALRHRVDLGTIGAARRALCAARADCARRQLPRRSRAAAHERPRSRRAQGPATRPRSSFDRPGNHDPDLPKDIGGRFADALAIGALTFRHQPTEQVQDGEIAGRLHPVSACRAARARGQPALFRRRWPPARHAGIRRLYGRPQCARRSNLRIVRFADIHRAHAWCAAALRHRGGALPAGLIVPVVAGSHNQSLLNATLAIQPVRSAMQAVAKP